MITRGQYETGRVSLYIRARLLSPAEVSAAVEGQMAICRGEYETGRAPQPSAVEAGGRPSKAGKDRNAADGEPRRLENGRASRSGTGGGADRGGEGGAGLVGSNAHQAVDPRRSSLRRPISAGIRIGITGRVWEEGSELLTAWIALTDVTERSGPMRFVRGSHRWGSHGGRGQLPRPRP